MIYRNYLKHVLDFFLSLIGLIVISPLFLIITIILVFTNRGKPYFIQSRPGKNEKLFKLIKFKTMNDRTDSNGKLLADQQRLTNVGKFIRMTSLDEIPQLINILKGDMSIIGPRPLLIQYIPYYTKRERIRHTLKPGITGYAQVNGRNNLNWDERLEMDVFYVENMNFKMDAYIFVKTIINVLNKKDVLDVPGKKYTTLNQYRKYDS